MNYKQFIKKFITVTAILFFTYNEAVLPCTRVLKADLGKSVMVGRTMDWGSDLKTNLWIYPRGMNRDGHTTINSLQWTSTYGSIVATTFDATTVDGMNEKGLAAHLLWLNETNYGIRNNARKGLSVFMWAQFYLDNFQNINEAVEYTNKKTFQVEAFVDPDTKNSIKLHLVLEDASGDSAIIECVKGVVHIYHNTKYIVATNSPTYDKQLKNVLKYKGFGGDKSILGGTGSTDRFARASYYAARLPAENTSQAELISMLSVMRNVAEPYSIQDKEHAEIDPTQWLTVANLTERIYYFNSSNSLNFIWTDLNKFNLASDQPILKLNLVEHPDMVGDVSGNFSDIK